ncbi:hypothetical protein ACFQ5M_04380 [Agrilactobacillus yilanensis]|uniref:Uncharacterized protein n=1 Tax=Agrilactobacillus yilanensis TaxID=2485997 RepID=A0ABW4J4N3_9LACO|nr:hypothetical protein [Agrilactobacillus yilanensis]
MSLAYERDSETILEDLWQLYDVDNSDDRSFNRIMIYPKHLLWKEAQVQDKIESSHNAIINRPVVVASFNNYEDPMVLHVLKSPTNYDAEKAIADQLAALINELIASYAIESNKLGSEETEHSQSN